MARDFKIWLADAPVIDVFPVELAGGGPPPPSPGIGKYSNPITKLIERLEFHKATGQMLAGLDFRKVPKKQVEGADNFPTATLFIPTLQESTRAGGRSAGHGHGVMLVNISVSVRIDHGIPELMVWCEKVIDAIFTAHDGSALFEPTLAGSLSIPLIAKVGTAFVLELSLNADITCTVQTQEYRLNERRL